MRPHFDYSCWWWKFARRKWSWVGNPSLHEEEEEEKEREEETEQLRS